MFEAIYYIVASIDGDYANLRKEEEPNGDLKLVARALLPAEIMEGSRLKYEMMQYEIVSQLQYYKRRCFFEEVAQRRIAEKWE